MSTAKEGPKTAHLTQSTKWRYEKRNKFYKQNNIFKSNREIFHRETEKSMKPVDKIPSNVEMKDCQNKI